MPMSIAGRYKSSDRGFSYVVILVAVIVVGIMAQVGVGYSSRAVRADREAELLFRGLAYRTAIQSYYNAGGAIKSYPRALEDLLVDPRFPNRHHLRRLYADPFATGSRPGWVLVHAVDGGIAGVASVGADAPQKKAGFPLGLENFAGAKNHGEWIFEYRP